MPTSFLAVSGSAVRPDWGGGIIRWHVIGGGGGGGVGGGGGGNLVVTWHKLALTVWPTLDSKCL